MYALLKKILFCLNPEHAHHLVLSSLKGAKWLKLLSATSLSMHPCTIMNLSFPNPIGLAAGFDKNGDYIDVLAALGFGFIEIGTVTPRPQRGHPTPRLFRLPTQEALINRMGFNNKGIDYVVKRLQQCHYQGILGINIGKNTDTPLEQAIDDYEEGFKQLWPFASYITLNLSSPNTPGLRDLQHGDWLKALLTHLKKEQQHIYLTHQKYVPLVLKISPDLSAEQVPALAETLLQHHIDGVIATNTTLDHRAIATSPLAQEAGGLSGRPLSILSTQVLQQLHGLLPHRIPLIASGGIVNERIALEKWQAGASLLQLYTGLIYHGPALIKRLLRSYSTVTDLAK